MVLIESFVNLSRLKFHQFQPSLSSTVTPPCGSVNPAHTFFIFTLVVVYSPEMEKLPETGDRTASVLLISWMCVRVCVAGR